MIASSLEEIATEMQGKVKIVKLNIDENPAVASKLGIRSIPTLILFKDGKAAAQKVGAAAKGELTRWITAAI
jgi:thioredoxin 1